MIEISFLSELEALLSTATFFIIALIILLVLCLVAYCIWKISRQSKKSPTGQSKGTFRVALFNIENYNSKE